MMGLTLNAGFKGASIVVDFQERGRAENDTLFISIDHVMRWHDLRVRVPLERELPKKRYSDFDAYYKDWLKEGDAEIGKLAQAYFDEMEASDSLNVKACRKMALEFEAYAYYTIDCPGSLSSNEFFETQVLFGHIVSVSVNPDIRAASDEFFCNALHVLKGACFDKDFDSEECVLRLEHIIGEVSKSLAGSRKLNGVMPTLAHESLKFLTKLCAYYVAACQSLAVGTSSDTFITFLRLFTKYFHFLPPSPMYTETKLKATLVLLNFFRAFYPAESRVEPKFGMSYGMIASFRDILLEALDELRSSPSSWYSPVLQSAVSKIDEGATYSSRPLASDRWQFSRQDQLEVVRLSELFSSYRTPVTIDRLVAFLGQFPSKRLAKSMLNLLRHTRYYTLGNIQWMIEESLCKAQSQNQFSSIVPLGEYGGSTSLMNYLAAHTNIGGLTFTENLAEHIEKSSASEPVVFIDDCCLSGTQTINIIKEFLGVRKLSPHHERHCSPLQQPCILKQRSLIFVYAISTELGEARVRDALAGEGIRDVQFFSSSQENLEQKPFTSSMSWIWSNRGESIELREFLADVGYQILQQRSGAKHWDDDRRKESALGYSNAQRLLAFTYNVPKTTLTPLWERGSYSGKLWEPLFPGSDT